MAGGVVQEKDSKPPTFIQIVSVAFSLTTVVPANDTPKEVSRLVTCLCCKVKASILGVEDQTPVRARYTLFSSDCLIRSRIAKNVGPGCFCDAL